MANSRDGSAELMARDHFHARCREYLNGEYEKLFFDLVMLIEAENVWRYYTKTNNGDVRFEICAGETSQLFAEIRFHRDRLELRLAVDSNLDLTNSGFNVDKVNSGSGWNRITIDLMIGNSIPDQVDGYIRHARDRAAQTIESN